jgi:hypothetical protein
MKMFSLSTLALVILALSQFTSALRHPMAYGTVARQDLAAKNENENEVLTSSLGYSLDDKSQAASYARGDGPTDANVQLSADVHTDSNAVSGSTEGGSDSENGYAVSNVKSELSLDDKKALFNSNPKYHKGFPGAKEAEDMKPYRTYTLSTNLVTGRNTNSATRGVSSRRGRGAIGVTSNRSQNNATAGRAISSGLSLANGVVNNSKVHAQLKAKGHGDIVTKNDFAAAQVKGIAAAVQKGYVDARGKGSEASTIQAGQNDGFGFTQTAGSAYADDSGSSNEGHIKAFYNPVRRSAGTH